MMVSPEKDHDPNQCKYQGRVDKAYSNGSEKGY